jgi:predicted lipid-binding transport protein (Tim44 family)
MIAAFLIYRLRSVLGRRTGHQRPREQQNHPYAGAPKSGQERADNVVDLPGRDRARQAPPPPPIEGHTADSGVDQGLTQIKIADPSFDDRQFLEGAQGAFAMIVEAYANGDTGTLRPLLSDDLYDAFSQAIRERLQHRESLETSIERMKDVTLVEAKMEAQHAVITVRFVTDQINVTRDAEGEVVDGDPETATEVVDLWTFSRNTRSDDPNWLLVATATPEDGEEAEEDGAPSGGSA